MCRRVAYFSIKDKSERGVSADLKQNTIRQKTSWHKKTEVEKLTEKRFLFLFIFFFRLNHAFIMYLLLIEISFGIKILLRWRSESTWEAFSLNGKNGFTNGLR